MPYTNVPKRLWGKMDRCVERVMAKQKVNKPRAIAICHGSVVGKELEMSNARKKRKKKSIERKAALAVADEPLADKELEEITDEEAQERLEAYAKGDEKYGVEVVVVEQEMPYGGAQSWADLEEYREAQAQTDAVQRTEYEFRKIVSNILEDETLELSAKGDKIASLAEGFSGHAEELTEDLKELEAEQSADIITKVLSAIGFENVAKARMTRASINDLPDSAFAYIEPGGKKEGGKTVPRSLRHYPVHDAAHVRNALARAAQMIKKGGKAAGIAKKALPKIRAKAKKMGIGKSSGFIVEKDLQGKRRWFGWVSNKYRDRDVKAHPKGEIIAEAAHKEFVDWVYEKTEERMPQLWLWHTPKTAMKARADWLDYADGFLLASGTLMEKEAGMFERLSEKYDLAMSHGFFKLGYDSQQGIITKYRQLEGSVLPRQFAANEWTDFQEAKEMGFTPEHRQFLVDALGEEKVADRETSTKEWDELLKGLDIEFKEVEEEQVVVEEKTTLEKPVVAEATETDVKEIIESLGLDKLSEYLEGQEAVIKALGITVEEQNTVIAELKKSDDEKVADALKPKIDVEKDIKPVWLRQLSKSDETILTEEEEESLKVAKETGASWVSGAMGVTADPGANVPM